MAKKSGPRKQTRAPKAEGGLLSSIFSGKDYQSTGDEVVDAATQRINWGDADNKADYVRAANEVMRRQRAEENANRKTDPNRIEVTELPAPKPTSVAEFSRLDYPYPQGQRPADLEEPAANPVAMTRDSDINPRATLAAIRGNESGNVPTIKNPNSTAGGLYQFLDTTWANVLRRMDPNQYGGMTHAQLAPLRKSADTVDLQNKAAEFHMEKDIIPALNKGKVPVNPGTIYLGWFQGPAGAVRAYNAPSSATVRDLFPETISANANMRYRGKPYAEWTRDDLVNWAQESMAKRLRPQRAEGGRTGYANFGAVDEPGEDERKTLTEAMLGKEPDLPKGELTMSAPTEVSLGRRIWNALPSPSTYMRALEEELEIPRRSVEAAKQIGHEDPHDSNATMLSGVGSLGYLMAPITAAQNVFIRDPIIKMGGSMERANRGVNVSDALAMSGGLKYAAKKAIQDASIRQLARNSKNAKFMTQASPVAQLEATGLMMQNPPEREERAVGGSLVEKAMQLVQGADELPVENVSFLGKRAKLTPSQLKQLGKAERRLAEGEDPERVRRLHGWTQDPNKAMVFELSDKDAKLRPEGLARFRKGENVTLGELLDHPALFDAYPSSFSKPVSSLDPSRVGDKLRGEYDHIQDRMGVRRDMKDRDLLDTLLHEHQHRIQNIEGFAGGNNPRQFRGPDVEGLQRENEKMKHAMGLARFMDTLPEGTGWLDAKEAWLKHPEWEWYFKDRKPEDVMIDFNALNRLRSKEITPQDLLDQIQVNRDEILKREAETPSAYEQYRRSQGEIQARRPGERYTLSELERRREPTVYPEDQLIQRAPPAGLPLRNDDNLDWDIFKQALEYGAQIREPRDKGGKTTFVKHTLRDMLSKLETKPSTVKLPEGRVIDAKPIPEIEAAASNYMRDQGRPDEHKIEQFVQLNPHYARAVAQAFQDMQHKPGDPSVRRAYDALIDETMAQYRALKDTGIDFRFLREGQADPYAKSPALGYEDLAKNGRLFVFPTEQGFGSSGGLIADNPLLKRVGPVGDLPNAMANDAFRVVHDAYGHFGPGNPFFRAPGEERAYQLHSRMYSDDARPAMTSETRGQNSWVNYGPYGEANRKASGADTHYADQKIGKMPDWTMGSPDDPAVMEEALRYLKAQEGKAEGGEVGADPKIVPMHPEDYIACAKPLKNNKRNRKIIDKFKAHMASGGMVDPLVLYNEGGHKGRHRAHAAKEMGFESVPVLINVSKRSKAATGGNFNTQQYYDFYNSGLPKMGWMGQFFSAVLPKPTWTPPPPPMAESTVKTPEFNFKPYQPGKSADLASLPQNFWEQTDKDVQTAPSEPQEQASNLAQAPAALREETSAQTWKNMGAEPEREKHDKGGKTIIKRALKGTPKQVFPDLAHRYPQMGEPVEVTDKSSGKTYLAKGASEEAAAVQKARKIAQDKIDRGEYQPYFDPAKRYDANPANYDPYIPTLGQRRVTPEAQAKFDAMTMSDEALARLQAAYERGLQQREGAGNWFYLGQLEKKFIDELGPVMGPIKFKERIADAMAATTGGADPRSNLMMAQFGNFTKEAGNAMPSAAYEFPFPIGGRFVSGNMDQYRKMIMEGQGVTPDNPKRYNFSYNFLGNPKGATIDEQMMGLIRPGVNVPEPGTYGHHEAPVHHLAAQNNVDPRFFQEVGWGGTKDMKTPGGHQSKPFISDVNEAIERTHQITGQPHDEIVKQNLIRGKGPLFALPGAGIGIAAFGNVDEVKDDDL